MTFIKCLKNRVQLFSIQKKIIFVLNSSKDRMTALSDKPKEGAYGQWMSKEVIPVKVDVNHPVFAVAATHQWYF